MQAAVALALEVVKAALTTSAAQAVTLAFKCLKTLQVVRIHQ
jgi:hypothetical protein